MLEIIVAIALILATLLAILVLCVAVYDVYTDWISSRKKAETRVHPYADPNNSNYAFIKNKEEHEFEKIKRRIAAANLNNSALDLIALHIKKNRKDHKYYYKMLDVIQKKRQSIILEDMLKG